MSLSLRRPNWTKVGLILRRELRDQFRDRRTIFMIAILPLLLYPLLSIGLIQVAQFLRKHPTRVLFVAECDLPDTPPLCRDSRFVGLPAAEAELLHVEVRRTTAMESKEIQGRAAELIEGGSFDVVVVWLGNQREAGSTTQEASANSPTPLHPLVYYNAAKDRSRMAFQRIEEVLREWQARREYQETSPQISTATPTPLAPRFSVAARDISNAGGRRAALWSKILPFVVFVWALTGAFYPAIDLCAGEKERGTLETLLASAAERLDIVWGKLLTTMLFSGVTAILNMVCMIATAFVVSRQFAGLAPPGGLPILGPPPLVALCWIFVALIPITALFGSLAIALAAIARSTKEGQYYLMPLIMGFMPLMMLALFPAARLDLGTSLLPVTGVMLLLRHLMEGELSQVWPYAIPVLAVTGGCCLLAIRWAVDQFSNESVLFRSSERFGMAHWLQLVIRERGPTPSIPMALLCGLVILLIRFFVAPMMGCPTDWTGFVQITVVALVALVAAPALLMTLVLTSSPRRTLLLTMPNPSVLLAAVALAVCLHPLATALLALIRNLFPIDEAMLAPFQVLFAGSGGTWQILLLLAVLPACCEELAFRGFILSGLRHSGARWQAILVSSVLFGMAHGAIQQSMMATLFGFVLGFLAIHTGSLWPCIAFHATHNALGILASDWLPQLQAAQEGVNFVWLIPAGSAPPLPVYGPMFLLPSLVAAALLLRWIARLPFQETEEERWNTAATQNAVATG